MRISKSNSKPVPNVSGLVDGELQPLDRKRVLGPKIDEAFLGADGVCADGHALDQAVWIAFQQRPIHEGPWVTLVGIAEDVFHRGFGLAGELPLEPGGKTGAAAAAQTAAEHFAHHLLWGHLGEYLGQGLIPSRAMYSSILRGSMMPEFRRAIFTCRLKNSTSPISATVLSVPGA
jgi:hypothetical protein